MLHGLSEPPYFTWLRGLIDSPVSAQSEAEPAEPTFLVRFLRELPLLWRTDSRQRVRLLADRVRKQAGELLAQGAPAADRHLVMQSLNLTQIRMAGEMDKFSVVSWWEPVALEISRRAASDPASLELLRATLTHSLRNPNPFIQLSALLALNRMKQKPALEAIALRPIPDPEKAQNPDLARWINQLLAGEACYPDPALFR